METVSLPYVEIHEGESSSFAARNLKWRRQNSCLIACLPGKLPICANNRGQTTRESTVLALCADDYGICIRKSA